MNSMVEWKKLDDLLDFEQPAPYLVKSTEYDDSYNIPVLTAGQSLLLGYTNEKEGIYRASKENPTIIFDDFTTSFHWIDYDFKVKSSAMKMLRPRRGINFRYVYYSMCGINFIPGGHQRHWISKYSQFEIPFPKESEQNRIVCILDTFTSAIENLKEQIAQRRKQYEYYRDQLLNIEEGTPKDILSFGNDFQLKARIGWQGLTKKEYKSSGEYRLVTGTDFTNNHRIDFNSCVFVERDRYEQDDYIKLKVGDVLITKDGTLGKVAYIDALEMPATLNGGVFVIRDPKNRVLPKFIMYYLTSYHFKRWMQQNHTTGSIQHLTQKLLSSFTIPVLEFSEQSRIVSILDTFEASISNLEAQLKQREKQYEYYRNKLLTFE